MQGGRSVPLGSAREPQGPRHRRRRLHRLAPRRAAARARRHASASSTTSPPATARTSPGSTTTSSSSRATCGATSASTTPSRGCEVVFHQAALPSVPRSVQDPLTTQRRQRQRDAERAARRARRGRAPRRLRLVVVGLRQRAAAAQARGDAAPARSRPTRVAKLAAEGYCRSFSRVYGARDRRAALLQRLRPAPGPALAVRRGDPALHHRPARRRPADPIYGDGEQSRDFTYVDNVVEANLLAADAHGASGAVLNVATGRQASVNELADAIGAALGEAVEKDYQPLRTGDVRDSWADVSAARRVLGYEARVELEEGLDLVAGAFAAAG